MDIDSVGPVVLETLTNACSQNQHILNPAEHQLQQWQTRPGFHTILSVSISIIWFLYSNIFNEYEPSINKASLLTRKAAFR